MFVATNFVVATLGACFSIRISETVFLVASFSGTSSSIVRHNTIGRHPSSVQLPLYLPLPFSIKWESLVFTVTAPALIILIINQ